MPYHRLPELHERIKHDLPAANTSIWQALREALPVAIRQLKDHEHFLIRDLPESARPYKWTVDDDAAAIAVN